MEGRRQGAFFGATVNKANREWIIFHSANGIIPWKTVRGKKCYFVVYWVILVCKNIPNSAKILEPRSWGPKIDPLPRCSIGIKWSLAWPPLLWACPKFGKAQPPSFRIYVLESLFRNLPDSKNEFSKNPNLRLLESAFLEKISVQCVFESWPDLHIY